MSPAPGPPTVQVLVLAKTPVPGRVKTRLCPPCTPRQAAGIAAAALADTLTTVTATPDLIRTLVIDGDHPAPPRWRRTPQRGATLAERLTHAFVDTRILDVASLLIGMDTPQLTTAHLTAAAALLHRADTDAVLGHAEDGGWWALGLRDPTHATLLRTIATSTPDTGALTWAALCAYGLRVAAQPVLRDVDTMTDALAVAALCPPGSRFCRAVPEAVPA